MKFRRLNASIINNAHEDPSVYLAVCAFESLLGDMEDESGKSVEALPAGSDMLSAKLLWLCRIVKKIYQANVETLGGRRLLSNAIADQTSLEEELSKHADTESKLAEVRAENKELQKSLAALKAKNQEYFDLQKEKEELQQQIRHWSNLDMPAEKEQLRSLNEQVTQVQSEKHQLDQELEAARIELAACEDERESVAKQITQYKSTRESAIAELASLKEQCDQLEIALTAKDEEIVKARGRLANADRKCKDLSEELEEVTEQLSSRQAQVAELEDQKLPCQRQLLDEEERRFKKRSQEMAELHAAYEKLQTEHSTLDEQYTEKAGRHAVLQSTYDALVVDYKDKNDELKALEEQLRELEGKTDIQKHEAYKRQLQEKYDALLKINNDIQKTGDEIEALDQELERNQTSFRELTEKRDQKEEAAVKLAQYLKPLQDMITPDFDRELARILGQLSAVETSHGQLVDTLNLIQEVTGNTPMSPSEENLLQRTQESVHALSDSAGRLQSALLKCADAVRWQQN